MTDDFNEAFLCNTSALIDQGDNAKYVLQDWSHELTSQTNAF